MILTGVSVNSKTTRRRLTNVRLRGRLRGLISIYSSAKEKLQWSKEYNNWTDDWWSQVIWRDETKISLFDSEGHKYVRRRIEEMLHPDFIQATMKYPHSLTI
ncbi:transposable element Tcb1 transposase [Trichonephila clavipes]|nr:transposable element Tcb1 transposase [Trichonephila clavipes]